MSLLPQRSKPDSAHQSSRPNPLLVILGRNVTHQLFDDRKISHQQTKTTDSSGKKNLLRVKALKANTANSCPSGCITHRLSRVSNQKPNFVISHRIYLPANQFCAHLASTARSTLRLFFPLKGNDMHSTTNFFASSADSDGPSRITSS